MPRQNLREQVAEIGRHRDVASFEALRRIESRPPAQHLASIHRTAQHEHRRRVTVIGAAVAVLLDGAAELGHREHHDVTHALAQVLRERGERPAELGEPGRELAFARPLVDVRVPAGDIGEGDVQADVGLDELSDLQQRMAEPPAWVCGAVRRLVLRWIRLLQLLDRCKRFLRRGGDQPGRGARVQLLEGTGEAVARRAGRAQPERLQVVDRQTRRRAREDARQPRAEGHGSERRLLMFPIVFAVAVQPAVGCCLHARCARLHIVLRVEMTAG